MHYAALNHILQSRDIQVLIKVSSYRLTKVAPTTRSHISMPPSAKASDAPDMAAAIATITAQMTVKFVVYCTVHVQNPATFSQLTLH